MATRNRTTCQGELFPNLFRQPACVYCGRPGTTRDHVPPKCLLDRPFPPDLPTVPSCLECNQSLGRDQEYFLAILAQVSDSPRLDPRVAEGGNIDRMLVGRSGLEERIIRQLHVGADGLVSIEPEMDRICRVVQATAMGIYYKRYVVVPDQSRFSVVAVGPEDFVLGGLVGCLYDERFRGKRWLCLQREVFEYTFVRAWWERNLVCVMRFYGTLLAAVECPYPPNLKHRKRGVRHKRIPCPWPGFTG